MTKIPKKFLEKLQGKNVDTSKLESLASGIKKSDLADDQKVRQLLRQLAVIANVRMSQEKEDSIVRYIRNHNIQSGDMKTLTGLLKGKL
ncbi:stage VI sporulation protein F [Aneurinibacillus uraniidurans]|uniref:stage VI sporulation protein F n=1 Tax=Aneurinibacillus uraniidurans TaxID=2966586 RepID=UPI002349F967|nr:stage VI sporulation protein F [Aneurinibacillus sp. B1]WCN36719.1 stage VI sporulation protein F [Aneurinibacillus sp. B1]